MKNLNVSAKGPTTFKNSGNETLFIADYEYVKKSAVGWLVTKLWLIKALFCRKFALLNE